MNKVHQSLVIIFIACALAGCSSIGKLLGIEQKTALRQMNVVALAGANQNSATALDVVFIYDSNAKNLLPKSGPEWFTQKNSLLAGLATTVDVVSLQMPPMRIATDVSLPKRHKSALSVYAYANYLSVAGQTPGNLTLFQCVQISLEPDAISYRSCE